MSPRRVVAAPLVALAALVHLVGPAAAASTLRPYALLADNVPARDAFGFVVFPRLSWSLAPLARGAAQAAYRLTVCAASPPGRGACAVVFDSGRVEGAAQFVDAPAGLVALQSHARYECNVTVEDALGAPAWAAAAFVAGVARDADWGGAEWLAAPDAVHGRVRLRFAARGPVARAVLTVATSASVAPAVNGEPLAGGEWRCRPQADVALCATTRELDAAALVVGGGAAGRNVLGLHLSAGPLGAPPVWRALLTLFFADGSSASVTTRAADASAWRAGVSSWAPFAGGGSKAALAVTYSQAWERANAGWDGDADFDEAAADAAGPPGWAWAGAVPAPAGGGWGNGTACVAAAPEGVTATLSCAAAGPGATVTGVSFASFGTPTGYCGAFFDGACAAPGSAAIVAARCVGAPACAVPVASAFFGGDPCVGTPKFFSAQVTCSAPLPPPPPPPLFHAAARALFTPTRVVKTLTATSLAEPRPGYYVWALGENIVGSCAVSLPALAPAPGLNGTQLRFVFGERLYDDGTVFQFYKDQFNIWNNLTIVLDGSTAPSVVNTSLSQWTFQYVGVEAWPADVLGGPPGLSTIECYQLASDAPPRGAFASSSPLVDAIAAAQVRTIVNSNQGGLPLSDPERDDVDWLGDGHLAAETALTFLDAGAFYARSLDVLADVDAHCATFPNAANFTIPYIIPAGTQNAKPCVGYAESRPGLEWEVAFAVFVDVLALHYNNSRAVAGSISGVAHLVDSVQHLVAAGGGVLQASVWGDWANVANGITSDICDCGIAPPFVYKNDSKTPCACQGTTAPNRMGGAWSTAFYHIYALDALSRWSATLGDAANASAWARRRDVAGAAFGSAFVKVDAATGGYYVDAGTPECVRCMGASAMALMAPAASVMNATARAGVCAHLVAVVASKGGRLDTGVLATRWLLPALASCGAWDVAFGVLTATDVPSWGFWLARGMTTTCEQWWEQGTTTVTGGALSHPMFSTAGAWLVSGLAGVALGDVMAATPAAPFAVAPVVPAALAAASAVVETARGRVAASWAQSVGAPASLPLALNVTVPASAAARVVLPFPRAGAGAGAPPAVDVTEGGALVWSRGAYVPGVPGVLGATFVPPAAGAAWWAIEVLVGAGDYAFVASAQGAPV